MGGILHILRIPFTGLFIGGSAVIFITLISYYSKSRNDIFEAAFKVMLVKFVVSPYTPINAYFSVFLQTILGYLLFFRGFNKISPIILGFLSLLFSGFQKIIITTLIFGMTLWESIDVFIDFIISRILPSYTISEELTFSYLLVGAYILIHILGGLLAGWYASILPNRIGSNKYILHESFSNGISGILDDGKTKRKRGKWWLKPSSLIIFGISLILIIISFFYEEINHGITLRILIMIVRSILIIIVWYYFVSPLLLKWMNKFLSDRSKKRVNDINSIINVFPNIKSVIKLSWQSVDTYNGLRKIFRFIDSVLISYILFEHGDNGE